MNDIKWLSAYKIDVKKIDEQHQGLFTLMHQLEDGLKQGWNTEKIRELFDLLVENVIIHFADEEAYMTKFHYPERMVHVVEHRELIRQVEEVERQWNLGKLVVTPELLEYLNHWLVNHIQGPDHQLGLFLHRHGQA
jgi:hemerythrin